MKPSAYAFSQYSRHRLFADYHIIYIAIEKPLLSLYQRFGHYNHYDCVRAADPDERTKFKYFFFNCIEIYKEQAVTIFFNHSGRGLYIGRFGYLKA